MFLLLQNPILDSCLRRNDEQKKKETVASLKSDSVQGPLALKGAGNSVRGWKSGNEDIQFEVGKVETRTRNRHKE